MVSIKGSDKVCGVIGDPIAHTLSPLIHNALALEMGKRAIYVPFHVKAENLQEAIKGAHALGILGLNVTMPHKQEMFNYVVKKDESAEKIGAINTLIYEAEGYKGYNTDAKGLKMSLEEEKVEWKDKNVAIIGSGGAAYAAYAAVAKEAKSIHIFNRTTQKAEVLRTHMQAYFNVPTFIYAETDKCLEQLDIVIQTTGVGMGSLKNKKPLCTDMVLSHAKVAIDLIYEPQETLFLSRAKARGCQCINGFGMLFYQAVIAFELMHGIKCHKESVLQIKEQLLK